MHAFNSRINGKLSSKYKFTHVQPKTRRITLIRSHSFGSCSNTHRTSKAIYNANMHNCLMIYRCKRFYCHIENGCVRFALLFGVCQSIIMCNYDCSLFIVCRYLKFSPFTDIMWKCWHSNDIQNDEHIANDVYFTYSRKVEFNLFIHN